MKLAIGTAQFGMEYGIANRNGQVTLSDAARILNVGSQFGVDTIDTAAAYGTSELVLGQIGVTDWKIVTKLPLEEDDSCSISSWLETHIDKALARLKIKNLHGLLIHRSSQITAQNAKAISQAVARAKEDGKITNFGVSIYNPDELDRIYALVHPELVQVPLNAFDRRILESGWLTRLHSDGVEVHARSAYLQGLLLVAPSELPDQFAPWRPLFSAWWDWLQSNALDPAHACLSYLNDYRINTVVIGVDELWQLEHAVAESKSFSPAILPDFSCRDVNLIDPTYWQRHEKHRISND